MPAWINSVHLLAVFSTFVILQFYTLNAEISLIASISIGIMWIITERKNPFAKREDNTYIYLDGLNVNNGGVITGGTGMGKTTLRFHLIHYFMKKGYGIIDFDLKGESRHHVGETSVLTPGQNFSYNLIDPDLTSQQITETILLLIEELTPPQKSLLTEAIKSTVRVKGNLQDLFDAVLYHGFRNIATGVMNSATPIALINRLEPLQTLFGDIFNVETTQISNKGINFQKYNFIDLSKMSTLSSLESIRRFIEFYLQISLILHPKRRKVAVFIDEAQMILSESNRSVINQIITTLRAREIPVFLVGTRMDHLPPLLLDSSNYFLFRSSSRLFNHFEGIDLTRLARYEFVIRTAKLNEPKPVKLLKYAGKISVNELDSVVKIPLHEFSYDPSELRLRIIGKMIRVNFPSSTNIKIPSITSNGRLEKALADFATDLAFQYNTEVKDILGKVLMNNIYEIDEILDGRSLEAYYRCASGFIKNVLGEIKYSLQAKA